MRWQLAYPGAPLPLIGTLLGEARMPGGTMLPEFYNELGAMHGTIMVFLGVVPARRRRLRQLRAPAPDWRPGHGVPAAEHGELLVLLPRRRDRCWPASSCPAAPRSPGGRPTRRSPIIAGTGQTWWLDRDGLPDHLVAARRDQLHHHHRSSCAPRGSRSCASPSSCGRSSSRPSCCCWPSRRSKRRRSCS